MKPQLLLKTWKAIAAAGLVTAIVAGCGTKLEPETSCNFVQNSEVQRVSWKGDLPIRIYFHESLPRNLFGALLRAMARWEYALGQPAFKYAGIKYGPLEPAREGESVVYFMKTWAEERKNEQARTTIYWLGDQITESDIYVNNKNFEFAPGPTLINSQEVDFESLMLHEFGHVLGLQHNNANSSVMAEHLAPMQKRRDPAPIDQNSLKCEYGGG